MVPPNLPPEMGQEEYLHVRECRNPGTGFGHGIIPSSCRDSSCEDGIAADLQSQATG